MVRLPLARRSARSLLALAMVAGVWLGCAGSGERTGFEAAVACEDGDSQACACDDERDGTQVCRDGAFGACSCEAPPLSEEDAAPSTPTHRGCGDGGTKDGGVAKKCQVCDFDVDSDQAPVCPVAPACANGSLGAPAAPESRPDLDVVVTDGTPKQGDGSPAPSSPAGTCLDPQLRIRLSKLKVNDGGGEAYCIVEASDGVTSEAIMSMKTGDLDKGKEFPFPLGQTIFWGQSQPECTANNLTLSYYCFKVQDNSAWAAALKAMGDTAAAIGGSAAGASPYGWAFGLGGAAANAAAAGIAAAQKDDARITVQQTIPVSGLLDLANGRSWTIKSTGKCGLFCKFDWELTVEAWGCAEKLPTTK